MARIVAGLSGGVDSSVAAYLMKQEGHEVIGLFMKNWHDESVTISDECPWVEDSNDALIVAQQLGIPYQTLDLSVPYRERIVEYMFGEYRAGRTPNPDVLCNREIKFDVFLKYALELGADYVCTGHYCRKENLTVEGKRTYRLLAGIDNAKDQSYFLCQVNQQQLARALFPIGHLTKQEVRRIAGEAGLVTAKKKDSQGLCFVGKVRLPEFLQQQLEPKRGEVVLISPENTRTPLSPGASDLPGKLNQAAAEPVYRIGDGEVIGHHEGAHFYTIGQRKGLGIGGFERPLFIIGTDVVENVVYVGHGEDHPGLYRPALFIHRKDVHWVRPDLAMAAGQNRDCLARIRYRQPLEPARLFFEDEGMYIVFKEPQRGIAKGQFAAWYEGGELIGSGIID